MRLNKPVADSPPVLAWQRTTEPGQLAIDRSLVSMIDISFSWSPFHLLLGDIACHNIVFCCAYSGVNSDSFRFVLLSVVQSRGYWALLWRGSVLFLEGMLYINLTYDYSILKAHSCGQGGLDSITGLQPSQLVLWKLESARPKSWLTLSEQWFWMQHSWNVSLSRIVFLA